MTRLEFIDLVKNMGGDAIVAVQKFGKVTLVLSLL